MVMPSSGALLCFCLWISSLLQGMDSIPDPCKGVECKTLTDCYSSVQLSNCCQECLTPGCSCPEDYLQDCMQQGYPGGVLPIKGKFVKDYGNSVCTCVSEGSITCALKGCPPLPPGCTDTVTPHDSHCPRCVCPRPGHGHVNAGATYTQGCEVCVCPSSGGKLSCAPHPNCVPDSGSGYLPADKGITVKKTQLKHLPHEEGSGSPSLTQD